MPAPLISRDEVIARLLAVFQRLGYDGASLAELSRGTGLGKSSLYHYFPNGKEEMALAVLRRVHAWFEEKAVALLQGQGSPKERLERMLHALDSLYASGKNACVLGNLVVGGARQLSFTSDNCGPPFRLGSKAWNGLLLRRVSLAGQPESAPKTWSCRSKEHWSCPVA